MQISKHFSKTVLVIGIFFIISPNTLLANKRYLYSETQDLVDTVHKAHYLLVKEGEKALPSFAKGNTLWLHGSQYIFIIDDKGKCVFHPAMPYLVGKNLSNLKDLNNKPFIRDIMDITKERKPDASGWVFYYWPNPSTLSPEWKVSYIQKTILPDKKVWIICSGLYNIKIEPYFVTMLINQAAELILKEGFEESIPILNSSSSNFHFPGVYLFIIDPKGKPMFHPGFPSGAEVSLTNFKDYAGKHPIARLLKKLESAPSAKVQFLYRSLGNQVLQKKSCYADKITTRKGNKLVIGGCYSTENPIWLR